MRRVRLVVAVLLVVVAACVPATAFAQGARYAVVIQGTSGGDPYTAMHRQWLDNLATTLRGPLGLDATHLTVLAEAAKTGEQGATADNVRAVFAKLAAQAKAGDLVFVMLIGHGGGDGMDAKFNLVGPDLTVTEWAAVLKPIQARLAFVDATGASFPFLKGLAAPGRVIVTATATAGQKFDTVFADGFIRGLTAPDADADKNARISLLEAFTYATRMVKQYYAQAGTLSTEKAVFDDTGEGIPREAPVLGAAAGTVAALTYLDSPATPTSADPAVQQLLTRQRELTEQVDELRRQRPGMLPAAYDVAFEKLIIDLATVSREVRKRTGG